MFRRTHPFILIVVVLVVLAVIGYALVAQTASFIEYYKNSAWISDSEIFSGVDYKKKLSEFDLLKSGSKTFENNLDNDISKTMSFLKNRLPNFNWNEFDYKNDYIFAQFVQSELENPKALLWINLPKNMPYSYKNHTEGFEVKLNCVNSKSAVLDTFMENVKETNVSAVQLFQGGGYTLITKCANIDCTEVGPLCLLVPFGGESEAKVYDFN